MGNKNLEPSDRILLVQIERLYPKIYSTLVPIQTWYLAECAGCKRETVSRFLTAMRDQGYIYYKRETKTAIVDGKVAYSSTVLVQLTSACKEPQLLVTKNTPRRLKKREQDKAHKQCRSCGGVIQVSKLCVACGEVTIK